MTTLNQAHTAEQLDAAELNRLLEEGRVEEARRLARQLAAKWPASRSIQHLATVMEPPRVIASPPGLQGRSLDAEYAWLRENAHRYPGCWLGVYGNRLIAAHPDANEVRRAVRAEIGDRAALLHFEPARAA